MLMQGSEIESLIDSMDFGINNCQSYHDKYFLMHLLSPVRSDRPHPIVGLHHSIATYGQAYQAPDLYSS